MVKAFEAQVKGLDAFLSPYYEEEYDTLASSIREILENKNIRDRDYVDYLFSWLKAITYRFGKVRILPYTRRQGLMFARHKENIKFKEYAPSEDEIVATTRPKELNE
jgi:hypothetical protein